MYWCDSLGDGVGVAVGNTLEGVGVGIGNTLEGVGVDGTVLEKLQKCLVIYYYYHKNVVDAVIINVRP